MDRYTKLKMGVEPPTFKLNHKHQLLFDHFAPILVVNKFKISLTFELNYNYTYLPNDMLLNSIRFLYFILHQTSVKLSKYNLGQIVLFERVKSGLKMIEIRLEPSKPNEYFPNNNVA